MCFTTHTQQFLLINKNNKGIWKEYFCCSLALESTFNFSFPFLCCAGQNCLHLASVQGFLLLVERLVDLGADIDAKVTYTSSVWKK